eukprot:Rmarinus@m.26864
MDSSADPCEDFYQYACGGWIASTELRPDETRKVKSFDTIQDANKKVLFDIIRDDWPMLTELYNSCMDEDSQVRDGLLDEYLGLTEPNDVDGMFAAAGKLQSLGVDVLFDVDVQPAPRDPNVYVVTLNQGGLGVGQRQFYLSEGDEAEAERKAYKHHIKRMLELSGLETDAAADAAKKILAFEIELATVSVPLADLRDPEATCNMYSLDLLEKEVPLPWMDFFEGMGIDTSRFEAAELNVMVPNYFKSLADILSTEPSETISVYYHWMLVHSFSNYLGPAFGEETFQFYGKTLSGQDERTPLKERCVDEADGLLGELLGHYFVRRAFPESSRKIASELVSRIERAFQSNIESGDVDWLDSYTSTAALEKLSAVTNKIGYPEAWTSYGSLQLNSNKYFENAMQARSLSLALVLDRFNSGESVDKTLWDMTTPTVNAYYNPPGNEMVFPAGILRASFFDERYPAAMNFGGIGMVMGHELTHGFDDEGRNFDGAGALRTWWSDDAIQGFTNRAQCLIDQYSSYKVGDAHVIGEQTLGENIADNGGIRLAFHAYKTYVTENDLSPSSLIEGVTDDQLFFLSFAQNWCELMRPEEAKNRIRTDVHSPAKYRVQGPLTNFEEFSSAFQCPVGSAYNNPETRCRVW